MTCHWYRINVPACLPASVPEAGYRFIVLENRGVIMKKAVFVVFLTLFVSLSGWLGAGAPGEAAEGGKAVVNEQVSDLQERILNDQELMSLVMALSAEPEIQELMNDPAVLSAFNSGDFDSLAKNPRVMRLLENARVKEIQRRLGY